MLRADEIAARLQALDWHPKDWVWEVVPQCPLCGAPPHTLLSQWDRYGHEVWLVSCLTCGFAWLMRRLTPASYARYYREGWYRRFVAAVSGESAEDAETSMQANQRAFGRLLARALQRLPAQAGTTVPAVLDVGGSSGWIARTAADLAYGEVCPVDLIDPAGSELNAPRVDAYADVDTLAAAHPDRQYTLVLVIRTVDHFSDPLAAVRAAVARLAPDGYLWIDFLDTAKEFEAAKARYASSVTRKWTHTQLWHALAKLDHPCYFFAQSAQRLLHLTGLQPVRYLTASERHLSVVCRRASSEGR